MSDLTIYSAFLDNSEDPASQSVCIAVVLSLIGTCISSLTCSRWTENGIRRPRKIDVRRIFVGLRTFVHPRRGSNLTETGNCLGYRPIVDGKAGPYTWLR